MLVMSSWRQKLVVFGFVGASLLHGQLGRLCTSWRCMRSFCLQGAKVVGELHGNLGNIFLLLGAMKTLMGCQHAPLESSCGRARRVAAENWL